MSEPPFSPAISRPITARGSRAELIAALRLEAVQGLGARRIGRLVDAAGSAVAVVEAATGGATGAPLSASRSHPDEDDDAPRLGGSESAQLRASASVRDAQRQAERAARLGVTLLPRGAAGYPPALASLPAPPPVLRVRGRIPKALLSPAWPLRAVAVVGARRCSARARRFATDLGRDLAGAGVVVVSGLALGVDGAAHRGALAAAGRGGAPTVAVLGSGVRRVSPAQHRGLADAIVEAGGAVLGELPHDDTARPGNFPRRNRLISALSAAVAVVEAAPGSGTFHTVDAALEQGRPVFVVPDHPREPRARGGLALLRDGASPLLATEDLESAVGPLAIVARGEGEAAEGAPRAGSGARPGDPVDRALVERFAASGALAPEALTGDEVPRGGALLERLAGLEIEGWLERAPGGRYRLGPRAREPRNGGAER